MTHLPHRRARLIMLASVILTLQACAVVSVASTVASVAVGTVGLAADAAIGTVRIAGKVVGAGVDAVLPDSDKP